MIYKIPVEGKSDEKYFHEGRDNIEHIISYSNNNLLAMQPIEGQDLPTDYWHHVYLSADRGE